MQSHISHPPSISSVESLGTKIAERLFGQGAKVLVSGPSDSSERTTWVRIAGLSEEFCIGLKSAAGYDEAIFLDGVTEVLREGDFKTSPVFEPGDQEMYECRVYVDRRLTEELILVPAKLDCASKDTAHEDPREISGNLIVRVERSPESITEIRSVYLAILGRSYGASLADLSTNDLSITLEECMESNMNADEFPLDIVIGGISIKVSDLIQLRYGTQITVQYNEPLKGEIRCGDTKWGQAKVKFLDKNRVSIEVLGLNNFESRGN